jgi:hypothetical protein
MFRPSLHVDESLYQLRDGTGIPWPTSPPPKIENLVRARLWNIPFLLPWIPYLMANQSCVKNSGKGTDLRIDDALDLNNAHVNLAA